MTAVPSEFFAAVRKDAAERDVWITPQTRDMNPLYTGKDVSYIDTKQAQRAAEAAVQDAERLATLAWLAGAAYPAAELDKAWRQLVFGAHHDAITGTEGDQVYLDLLAGWREATSAATRPAARPPRHLAGLAATATVRGPDAGPGTPAVVVFNTLSVPRSGWPGSPSGSPTRAPRGRPARRHRPDRAQPGRGRGRHADGTLASVTLTFRALDVPGLGYRTYLAVPAQADAAPGGWDPWTGQSMIGCVLA